MSNSPVFRISFLNNQQVYEVYARSIYQSDLYGFVEIDELVFGERAELIVDPAEERLKTEFAGVTRSFIPMQSVIRIDEVEREGIAKISEAGSQGNVTTLAFPSAKPPPRPGS